MFDTKIKLQENNKPLTLKNAENNCNLSSLEVQLTIELEKMVEDN
jgi:hypothetical protein